MVRLYATDAELVARFAEADQPPPRNPEQLVGLASRVVDQLLKGRSYPTGPGAMPADPEHIEAMREATLAIAAAASEQGVALLGHQGGTWESVAIGSVRLSGRRDDAESGRRHIYGMPVPGLVHLLLAEVGHMSVMLR